MNSKLILTTIVVGVFLAGYVAVRMEDARQHEASVADAQAAQRTQEAHRAQASARFAQDRNAIIEGARELSATGKPAEAAAALAPYRHIDDRELQALVRIVDRSAQAKAQASAEAEARMQEVEARAGAEMAAEAAAEEAATLARIGPPPQRHAFSAGYVEITDYARALAHDPDSVEFTSCMPVSAHQDGWRTWCEYRARNAFGALVRDRSLFVVRHGVVSIIDS